MMMVSFQMDHGERDLTDALNTGLLNTDAINKPRCL